MCCSVKSCKKLVLLFGKLMLIFDLIFQYLSVKTNVSFAKVVKTIVKSIGRLQR